MFFIDYHQFADNRQLFFLQKVGKCIKQIRFAAKQKSAATAH